MMFIRTILALSLATFSIAVPVAQSGSGLPSYGEAIDSFNEGGAEVGGGAAKLASSFAAGGLRVACGVAGDVGKSVCGEGEPATE
ncbi:hypothetical protein V8E53_004458 [Lactarius tabidus]